MRRARAVFTLDVNAKRNEIPYEYLTRVMADLDDRADPSHRFYRIGPGGNVAGHIGEEVGARRLRRESGPRSAVKLSPQSARAQAHVGGGLGARFSPECRARFGSRGCSP